MTVLISQRTATGERRCDERCYNAKGKKCSCVCGGINHGVGIEQAYKNTQEMLDALEEIPPGRCYAQPQDNFFYLVDSN